MSRLAPDHRPPPPRVSTTHLHRPLQPRAPTPRTRAALAPPAKRGAANDRRPDQAPRPTRRTDPRIPPHRSMNRHFETPQQQRHDQPAASLNPNPKKPTLRSRTPLRRTASGTRRNYVPHATGGLKRNDQTLRTPQASQPSNPPSRRGTSHARFCRSGSTRAFAGPRSARTATAR